MDFQAPENVGPAAHSFDVVFLPTSGMAEQQAYWQTVLADWAKQGFAVRRIFWPSSLDAPMLAANSSAALAAATWYEFRTWGEFRKLYRSLGFSPASKLVVISGQNAATMAALGREDFLSKLGAALAEPADVVFPLADHPSHDASMANVHGGHKILAVWRERWWSWWEQNAWIKRSQGLRELKQALLSWRDWIHAWWQDPHPLRASGQRMQVLQGRGQQALGASWFGRRFFVIKNGLSGADLADYRQWPLFQIPWREFGQNILMAVFWILLAAFCLGVTFGSFKIGAHGQIQVAPKNFSDFVSHISLIRSFSEGYNYPVEYPLFTGEPIRYHYLYFWVVAILEKLGGRIDIVFNLLSTAGVIFLCAMIYRLAKKMFRMRMVGLLAVCFFMFHGALVIWDFLQQNPFFYELSYWTHIREWFQNNREWISFGPWNGSEISAFWNFSLFNNQRHLAYALGLSLLFIYRMAVRDGQKHPPLGEIFLWSFLISVMPVFHQPTVLIFAVLLIYFFIIGPHRKQIFLCGALAVVGLLLVNQFWFHFVGDHTAANLDFSGRTSGKWWSVIWQQLFHPFYLMRQPHNGWHFLTYWFKNLGLHLILIPLGVYWAPRRWRRYWWPALIVFIIGNTFQLSREMAGQHKLFNFFLVLSLPFSAAAIVKMARSIRRLHWRVVQGVAFIFLGLVFIGSVQGGIFDNIILWQDCHSFKYNWPHSKSAEEISTWIKQNSRPSDKFLSNVYLFNPASLVGRRIFLGWPYFAWSAGHNTRLRSEQMFRVYASGDFREICHFMHHHGLSWFYVQDNFYDRNFPPTKVQDFVERLRPAYFNEELNIAIYARDQICQFAEGQSSAEAKRHVRPAAIHPTR